MIGGIQHLYDTLGRLTRKGDLQLIYGPHGQLARAQRASQTWNFVYDEQASRVLKLLGNTPVAGYVDGIYIEPDHVIEPVRVADILVGVFVDGAFEPLATDPRGSIWVEPNGTRNLPSPYGVRAQHPELAPALDYVEKGFDADLGFVRMGVRDYDSFLGQFTTPDPLFLEVIDKCVESPTECNLFGYAKSNPVSFVDPTGTCVSFSCWLGRALAPWRGGGNGSGPNYQQQFQRFHSSVGRPFLQRQAQFAAINAPVAGAAAVVLAGGCTAAPGCWSGVGTAAGLLGAASAKNEGELIPPLPGAGAARGIGLVDDAARAGRGLADDVARVTGARTLGPFEWDAAEAAYNVIRATDDVASIARNTGWPTHWVSRVKDHLFSRTHILDDAVRRFDADPAIANAWHRLQAGTHGAADMQLLRHELFEAKFEGIFRTIYRAAHDAANRSGRPSGL